MNVTNGDYAEQRKERYVSSMEESEIDESSDLDSDDADSCTSSMEYDETKPRADVSNNAMESDEEDEEEESRSFTSASSLESEHGSRSSSSSFEFELESLQTVTHVYISVVKRESNRSICYGFNVISTKYGPGIVKAIRHSLIDEEDPLRNDYSEEHRFLMNRIVEMAFYDSDDEERFSKEENERWGYVSENLFGAVLGSEDVGVWTELTENEVSRCGNVTTTFVHCNEA